MTLLRYVIGLLIAACIMVTSHSARSQNEAPFGLNWGTSAEDLRTAGIELKEVEDKKFGTSYAAAKLLKVLADQEATLLSFGFNNKLWRIMALSRQFENDPYGTAVKHRYEELLAILSEKYGKPNSIHRLGGSIYSEPRYFVAGIRGGESSWYSNFNAEELDAQIHLQASDSSTARWGIVFEYKPLKKTFEMDRKGQEKRAL
jgi:hypothetical protein